MENVYPKFSVEFWWVKRRCSYHPSNAIYSPINHSFTPSKNLYFRENLGSKFVGDDNLIFHAVYRITGKNGKNYLFGRVLGRGWGKMISSFFWGGFGRNGWMMYRFYKLMMMFIEDGCNRWTNHQQRTTSTINVIVLMETGIWDEKVGRKGRGWWERWNVENGSDDIHIMAGLPYKRFEKFSWEDSALWKTDEDVIARWEHHPRW